MFESLLGRICKDARLERHWINMLSLLEYVGCRKILKSVPFSDVNDEVLRHVFEESLHALTLKRLVKGSNWGEFAEIGWEYFQALDEAISKRTSPSYHAVSWAIEKRVLELYPLYLKKTRSAPVKRALRMILAQERRHARVFSHEQSEVYARIEEVEWKRFVKRLGERMDVMEQGPMERRFGVHWSKGPVPPL